MEDTTLNKIIYNLKNSLNGGIQTDDFKFSDAQLEFVVNHFRAKLAAQRYNSGKAYQGFQSRLEQVHLKPTDDFGMDMNMTVYKSTQKIPVPLNSYKGEAITFVGYRNSAYSFQKTTPNMLNLEAHAKYTKLSNKWFIDEGYLYIVGWKGCTNTTVTVKGIFENPRSVHEYTNPEAIEGEDFKYPIPSNVVDELNALIMANELKWAHEVPKDLINDGLDG